MAYGYHGDHQGIKEGVKDTPAVLNMPDPFTQQLQVVGQHWER